MPARFWDVVQRPGIANLERSRAAAPGRARTTSSMRPAPAASTPANPRSEVATVANIKSQIKRNRQNETRRQRNQAVKSELRTRERRVVEAVEAGEGADEALRLAQKRIDMAASKGVLHKNTAARKKARLAKLVNDAS